jgi:acid stress-induced BolA-like protein IbaG/YrbA
VTLKGAEQVRAAVQPEEIKQLIEKGLRGARASVSGDGQHFEAIVIAEAFAGKSMVQQHQLVYQALGEKMKSEIHALSLRTYTPAQWVEHDNPSG